MTHATWEDTVHIGVKKMYESAHLPEYKHVGDAGADLFAYIFDDIPTVVKPGHRVIIHTGLKMNIPDGWEIQIRPRSGLAANNGITVLNSPGTIDSKYKGEFMIIVFNAGESDYVIHQGDRIAQMVLAPVYTAKFNEVDDVGTSDRGEGGFGSTGISNESKFGFSLADALSDFELIDDQDKIDLEDENDQQLDKSVSKFDPLDEIFDTDTEEEGA